MKPDEAWVGYRKRTLEMLQNSWRKMGLPLLTEKIASKIWTTMTWVVYEVMSHLCGLFVPWRGERPRGGEAWLPVVWHGTLLTLHDVTRWKHEVGFHNRGIQWDTPMARWAGEGNDWIKLMAQRQPRKEDVIHSLLASMRQAVDKKTKAK